MSYVRGDMVPEFSMELSYHSAAGCKLGKEDGEENTSRRRASIRLCKIMEILLRHIRATIFVAQACILVSHLAYECE